MNAARKAPLEPKLVKTGIEHLDTILHGGLPKGRMYLVEGAPGVGKTTLGLQFLLEGRHCEERVMLVSLIETRDELVQVAQSHGWSLEGVEVVEIPRSAKESATAVQTVFPPGEVEFGEVSSTVVEAIERHRPDRLLIDSISQLAMLTDNWQQMRQSLLRIRDMVNTQGITTLLTSSRSEKSIAELDTIVHGSLSIRMRVPDFGQIIRELIVKKIRGHHYHTGFHNYRITTGGIQVFNRHPICHDLSPANGRQLSSGNPRLDDLLGGGIEWGTACLINGSTGAGKTTLASLYVQAAARDGDGSVVICFDERRDTFLQRCRSLDLDIPAYMEQGLVNIRQVDAGHMSPGQFAHMVVDAVSEQRAKVVVIDSLTGYLNAMPEEKNLMRQLHDLLSYLNGIGVLAFMVVTQYGDVHFNETNIDASYIADTVIALRHFEAFGSIRRCIAVVKKRQGRHENTIREFRIARGGCDVGPPLHNFSGVLTGRPTFYGDREQLLGGHRTPE